MATPTMPEPFATIHAAVEAKLLVEGVTCYDHLPLELYGVPSAYLTVTDALPDYGRADQGELAIGQVPYSLKYFVSLEGDERESSTVDAARAEIAAQVVALRDEMEASRVEWVIRTLGPEEFGKVRDDESLTVFDQISMQSRAPEGCANPNL